LTRLDLGRRCAIDDAERHPSVGRDGDIVVPDGSRRVDHPSTHGRILQERHTPGLPVATRGGEAGVVEDGVHLGV
jgi:hypothetical protein